MPRVETMETDTGQLEVWTETLYIAHNGEFLREAWVAARYPNLPEKIIRPILSEAQTTRLYRQEEADRMAFLGALVRKEGVEEREYFPNLYKSAGRLAYNAEIVEDLKQYKFLNARRFPLVQFFVDELRDYPEDKDKPGAERRGKKWCHLLTNGDEVDLRIFAGQIGLKQEHIHYPDTDIAHYDLTPKRREAAIKAGARAVSDEELDKLVAAQQDQQAARTETIN